MKTGAELVLAEFHRVGAMTTWDPVRVIVIASQEAYGAKQGSSVRNTVLQQFPMCTNPVRGKATSVIISSFSRWRPFSESPTTTRRQGGRLAQNGRHRAVGEQGGTIVRSGHHGNQETGIILGFVYAALAVSPS